MIDTLDWLTDYYFPDDSLKIEPVPFGLTNSTCFVSVKGQKFVARRYDRYTKTLQSLSLEMNVTSFLKQVPRSFDIPAFLPARSGDPYVILPDGALSALVAYIRGSAPQLSTLQEAKRFGRIAGEMAALLREYNNPENFNYEGIPFTDIYRLHPLADEEAVASFWERPPFPVKSEQRQIYAMALASVKNHWETLMSLPRQLVHHDLLVFNLLAMDEVITGVLDFDFISVDIAFLEFAISLNHVLQMSGGSLDMAAAFIEGFAVFRTYSLEEIRQFRTLTHLYHVAILHIYIGQYRSGKDVSMPFAYIADQLIERDLWLESYTGDLERLLHP